MVERLKSHDGAAEKAMASHRAERPLGAVSILVCVVVLAMAVFVANTAWPIFQRDGIAGCWAAGISKAR